MKKAVVLWALFLGFALAVTGCAPAAQSQNGDTFAVKSAFSLSQTLGKLTASPECVALFAGNNTIVSEATSLSAMDLAKPTRAEIITLPQQSVDSLLDYLSSSLTEDETLKNLLIRRLAASVPSRINGQAGVSWLATSSVLTVSETFSRTDMAGITYVILYYDGHPAATLTLLMPDGGFI